MKNFVKRGHTLNYLNSTGSTITSGSVVIVGKLAGVCETDILDGQVGAVLIEGVFNLPKAAGFTIAQGDQIYWNATTGVTKTATDTWIGTAFEAALTGDLTAEVKFLESGDGAPIAADVAALTDNSGGAAADGTIGVITAPDLSTWNGSSVFPTAAQATAIAAADTASRDAIKELATKVNAILAALKAAGLMA